MNTTTRRRALIGIVSLALVASACGSDGSSTNTTAAGGTETTATGGGSDLSATLNASGATFPKTFYEEAIAEFTGANAGVTINYAGGGSGKGRQDLADDIVRQELDGDGTWHRRGPAEFGAGDAQERLYRWVNERQRV